MRMKITTNSSIKEFSTKRYDYFKFLDFSIIFCNFSDFYLNFMIF